MLHLGVLHLSVLLRVLPPSKTLPSEATPNALLSGAAPKSTLLVHANTIHALYLRGVSLREWLHSGFASLRNA